MMEAEASSEKSVQFSLYTAKPTVKAEVVNIFLTFIIKNGLKKGG